MSDALIVGLLSSAILGSAYALMRMRANHYRQLWIQSERKREAHEAIARRESANCANARIEVCEWVETAGKLAGENKTYRETITKLKQEVTKLHDELDEKENDAIETRDNLERYSDQ